MRLRIVHSDGQQAEVTLKAKVVRLGRDAACEVPFDAAVYPSVSSQHAQIERTAGGLDLVHVSQRNKTLVNGQPIEGRTTLAVGDSIRLGYTGPIVVVLALSISPPQPQEKIAGAKSDATMAAGPQHLALLRGSAQAADRIQIGEGGAIGRERGKVRILLEHPHVSRFHASLAVAGKKVVLADTRSANGTYVNGSRIDYPVELVPGDRIDIGPFSLEFDGTALVSRSRANHIELAARGLSRVVTDRASGKPLTLLDRINLVIKPREFVCLLGPSGSGKSTLLAMLSGRNPPDEGSVTVNGEDLYENFDALKQDMAVVPQKDVLHDTLAVGDALRFTAELRLPPDTSRPEIESSVSDILGVVALTSRNQTLIRHLSGGQVKRASLANELVARPSLLFLDEVTSGLDEQTDRDMMELFRQVADGGKTVVCITHNLANVEATCHLVVILTEGGRLAFVGTPEEARTYFSIARLGDVYRKLAEQKPAHWQSSFMASPLYARYVAERLPAGTVPARPAVAPLERKNPRPNPFRQAHILTRRNVAIWRGDALALGAMLGQSLLVAALLAIVFGKLADIENPIERAQRTVNLLFLLTISCFWFGCNNAAKELVKERIIFSRERDFNLRTASYLASKFLVLTAIGVIQITLLYGIVKACCGPPGAAGQQWLALALLATAGATLGLLISAFARTEEVAVALVPIAVIPQIILAGAIAPLKGLSKLLAQGGITCYWGKQSLDSLLPIADQKLMGLPSVEYSNRLAMLAIHAAVFTLLTVLVLWQSGRRGT